MRTLLLLTLLGETRAAIDASNNASDLRAAVACADLKQWADFVGAGACEALHLRKGHRACAVAGNVDACTAFASSPKRRGFIDSAVAKARKRKGSKAWAKTCAFTISAYNNWGVVKPFVESLTGRNPHLRCAAWFVADAEPTYPHADPPHVGAVSTIRAEFRALAASLKPVSLTLETLADVDAAMPFDVSELAFRYGLKTFSTAVKPWVFKLLFDRGHAAVLYFDPDVRFYSHLDEVALLLHRKAFVVTPHITRPYANDGAWQTNLQIMRAGAFNFGFVAVSRRAFPAAADHFVDWWGRQLRFQGGVDLARGLHFDQNWGVFVTSFYPSSSYEVLVDPRYNAAYWNLHYRGAEIKVSPDGEGATYRGAPLVFFHFSGVATDRFDPAQLSPHQTRFTLADLPNLEPLFRRYAAVTSRSRPFRAACAYGLGVFSNGAPVPECLRDLYAKLGPAEGPLEALEGPGPFALAVKKLKGDPFDAAGPLWKWLLEHRADQVAFGPDDFLPNVVALALQALGVDLQDLDPAKATRWFATYGSLALRADAGRRKKLRPYVRDFPRHFGADACCLLAFDAPCLQSRFKAVRQGYAQLAGRKGLKPFCQKAHRLVHLYAHRRVNVTLRAAAVDRSLRREAVWSRALETAKPAGRPGGAKAGVNVLGYFDGVFGVAESARLVYRGLARHLPAAAINLLESPFHAHTPHGIPTTRDVGFHANVVVQNADMTKYVRESYPWRRWRERYNIGYWAWETDRLPEAWADAALAYDEVWASSEFTARAIRRTLAADPVLSKIPVHAMAVGADFEP